MKHFERKTLENFFVTSNEKKFSSKDFLISLDAAKFSSKDFLIPLGAAKILLGAITTIQVS
jgi:hypothetical protein